MLLGQRLDLLHVDAVVILAHRVGNWLEPLARQVHGRTVRQMAAGGEIEAHEGVSGRRERQEHRLVRLAAGVGLHIGEAAAKKLLRAINREVFGDIDILAAAVIALARIAFAYLLVRTEPWASNTARETMFSEAISSIS